MLTDTTLHAERERGCVFSEDFRNSSTVVENGGTPGSTAVIKNGLSVNKLSTDTVTFDIQNRVFNETGKVSGVIRFIPNFNPGDITETYTFFETTGTDYSMFISSNKSLYITLGDSWGVVGTGIANYRDYWKVGEENILSFSCVSGEGSVWLNGHCIANDDPSTWSVTSTDVNQIRIGSEIGGSDQFDGKILEAKFFNTQLTDQECLDYSNGTVWNYKNETTLSAPMDLAHHDHTNMKTLEQHGRDGVISDADLIKDPNNKGYIFDGSVDTITFPTPTGGEVLSVSIWFKRNEEAGTNDFFWRHQRENDGLAVGLYLVIDEIRIIHSGGASAVATDTFIYRNDYSWYNIVLTIDENKLPKVYLNGELIYTTGSDLTITDYDGDFMLGNTSYSWAGTLCMLNTWNDRVLTPMQIKDLYYSELRQVNDL